MTARYRSLSVQWVDDRATGQARDVAPLRARWPQAGLSRPGCCKWTRCTYIHQYQSFGSPPRGCRPTTHRRLAPSRRLSLQSRHPRLCAIIGQLVDGLAVIRPPRRRSVHCLARTTAIIGSQPYAYIRCCFGPGRVGHSEPGGAPLAAASWDSVVRDAVELAQGAIPI